ncbi:MAG TPA: gliding motility-associated C-terminal domain-containing protein, partial [Cyclobacteriaceae bacterium]
TLNVINTAPNGGTDNSVSGCDSNTAFDLFASLGGTPDPGGTWTDMDGSGATITGDNVNLNGVAAGSYRYQYNLAVSGCGSASAIVTVTVVPAANAGSDKAATACNSNNAFDLLASLGGLPTSGGSWTDVDGSGVAITGNLADLTTVTTAGIYHFTYTVTGTSPCPDATATVTLTISIAPNSGTAATVSACTSDAAFNLFTNLGGTPDATGTWTDLDGSKAVITGNIADFTGPTVVAGTFRFQYTVTATAPCVDAQTILTVTLNRQPIAGTNKTVSACGSTSSFDLFASLGGTPDSGGTWTDLSSSGAVITGNNADFTSVAAGTYQYQYTVTGIAPCADATAIVTVNVTAAPTTANAGPDQVICGAAFTTLAANAPGAGETGTWTVSPSTGAVVTSGSPTSLFVGSAGTSYTLQWIITSGSCAPSIDAVVINFAASPTSTSPVTACVNTATPTLNATATGATSIEWYTDAALTNLVFTGASYTPASTELDMTTTGSTTFYVIARYSCGASPATQVVVNVSNTGACGGGGGTGTCATVVIDPVPTPANCALSTGSIMFNITPQVPAVNNTGVRIDITGPVNDTKFNAFNFTGLPAGKYDYTIEYGDPSCIKTGSVTIDKSGTVGTPVASSIVPPTCFGDSTGSAVITITQPVDITGQALQWSLTPAVASSWKDFTAGGIIQGIPAGVTPSFNQTISIRKDATDVCYAGVTIVMPNGNTRIKSTYDITAATCNNNDGAITNIVASGGAGGTYQFSLDGVTFQTTNSFTQLFGGYDTLRIKDNIGCIRDTVVHITFPGEIVFGVVASSATCTNNGKSGEIDVSFASAGDYKVGLSTDPLTEPTDYLDDPLNSTTFPPFTGLSRGTYYVWVKGATSACPSRQTVFVDGVFTLSFTPVPVCQDNLVSLRLENITYDASSSAGPISVLFDDFFTGVNQMNQPIGKSTDILLDVNQSPWSNFFALKGKYRYHLEQFQSNFCLVESDTLVYEVLDQLQEPQISTVKSFEDQTDGKIILSDFKGGMPLYKIYIKADSIPHFEQSDIVEKNSNLQYEITYKNLSPESYTIVLTDSLGCSVQFNARVPVDKSLFIPNVFTPNGDGDNDDFEIRNLPDHSKMVITNRWGKEVFLSNNYLDNWWKGEGVSDGIYYYYLKTPSETKSGWVEIIRGNKP